MGIIIWHTLHGLVPTYCSDVDGVIRRANATEFGLASGVFTNDINKVCVSCSLCVDILILPLGYVRQ